MYSSPESSTPTNPYLMAITLAVLTIVPGLLLPENITMIVLALLLFGIAAVYFGFAVADGRHGAILTESLVVLVYLALATGGLLISAWVLVAGYVLHGVWDLLHHNPEFGARVIGWYIPFCVLYDWLIALFLIILIVL